MARPLIGITVGSNVPTGKYTPYQLAVDAAGGLALLIPPTAPASEVRERFDGLVLPGGGDVNPALYGQPNTASQGIDDDRDRLEVELVRTANIPILAICRGIQVVNVALNGTLLQDVPDHQGTRHGIRLKDGGSIEVNSRHHQALKDVAPELAVTATSEDGVIEGVESRDGRIRGVQCHPEDLVAESAWARELFADLVKKAQAGSFASASPISPRARA